MHLKKKADILAFCVLEVNIYLCLYLVFTLMFSLTIYASIEGYVFNVFPGVNNLVKTRFLLRNSPFLLNNSVFLTDVSPLWK